MKKKWMLCRKAFTGMIAAALICQSVPVHAIAVDETSADGASPVQELDLTGSQARAEEQLLAHYDFSSVEQDVIADVSGNGFHGTLKGTGGRVSDGELVLPGGAANSDAAYVELPKGMFDGKDTLTVSMWLKNETERGNYVAMYFGTESTSHYWLMNPGTFAGTFKSVITKNSFNGEYGFSPTNAGNGIAGPASSDQYAMYTTVIEPGKMTLYYDGKGCGSVDTGISVHEFGEGLSAYLGRSPYPDIFLKGRIRNVKIYQRALAKEEIEDHYYTEVEDAEIPKKALLADKDALQIGGAEIASDLSLPKRGENGSKIIWTSSQPDYLAADGKVTRPNEAVGDVKVTLTARLSLGGQTETKVFEVTVLADTPDNNVKVLLEGFSLGQSVATEDIVLPAALGDQVSLRWTSSHPSVISQDGKVARPESGEGNVIVTLTAEASCQGVVRTKRFQVEVVERPYGKILTYVREGNTERTDALHYAYSRDGERYEALNSNRPILYWNQRLDHKMGSPSLFRKADGTYGLVASDNNSSTRVIVYDSKDLLTFTNPRTVSLNQQGIHVLHPVCRYDSAFRSYTISYQGSDGKSYEVGTKDFQEFTQPVVCSYQKAGTPGILPQGAVETNVFEVTKQEYDAIVAKWQRVVNTSVTEPEAITIEKGGVFSERMLPKKATANYSDGSAKEFGVQWDPGDIQGVDVAKPGTYTINGTLNQPKYSDILVGQRADPWTFLGDDGYYYFTGSYPVCGHEEEQQKVGYDRIVLRRSKTLEGLKDAEETVIWHADDNASTYRYIWAPEIHQINGKWYVFYTASLSGQNPYDIRPHVLECVGDDPMERKDWRLHKMQPMEGDTFALNHFSLDMTHFESAGTHYVVWAANPGDFSKLYIATVDPGQPWRLTSKSTQVTMPDFAWENPINEGPAVIKNNGMVYLCFSAAAVNYTYCVGMLSAKEGDNLLELDAWEKYPIPLLSTDDLINQCGPGHNSFTIDENGNPVIVYHARPILECSSGGDWNGTVGRCPYVNPGDNSLLDPCRHARVKSVNFAVDGTPILNMTPEEELKSENKRIQVTVTIKDTQITPPKPVGPSKPDKKIQVKSVRLSAVKYTYNGKVKTPKVTVTGTDGKKISTKDYKVSYPKGRKQPGIYRVKVTMRNRYQGTYTLKFKIYPKAVSWKKAQAGKKEIRVSWKKPGGSITGYQIQYGTDKKFKKKATALKSVGKSKGSYRIRKLKRNKTYYVRIRAYKKSGNTKLYGAWSKRKPVKVK